jgi:transposase
MYRMYGYAPCGQRLESAVPFGHYKRLTFVAGLTSDGIIAAEAFVGSMTSRRFAKYIENVLAPVTRPGDRLILDNLPAHKTKLVQQTLARHKICYQYLPPYSPDLNPIERVFSKMKRFARHAAERTLEGLQALVPTFIARFDFQECSNYFRGCGYDTKKCG